MADPFFQKKRKRGAGGRERAAPRARRAEESDSDEAGAGAADDMDLLHRFDEDALSDEAEAVAAETPAEAKVRLARMYLEGLHARDEDAGAEGADAAAIDRENIAARLHKDVDESSGRLHVLVADRLQPPAPRDVLAVRGHRASVTCACTGAGAAHFFSADKDGRIVQWRLRDGRQVRVFPRRARATPAPGAPRSATSGAARRRARTGVDPGCFHGAVPLGADEGHTAGVLALALSHDGRRLASGGHDRRIGVWDVSEEAHGRWLRALTGHKDAVCALAFRGDSLDLFSASYDRSVNVFDASQLSYIETLFGHQEAVQDLACLRAERAVSAGGRERTCRLWKIRDETQLVFRGGGRSRMREMIEGGDLVDTSQRANEVELGSIDCVAMIDDHNFLSGSDAGSVALWSIAKKKPVFVREALHGFDERPAAAEGPRRLPRYITALACLPYGDVFATGSWDGFIRIWALDERLRSFHELFAIPAPGVVTSLQLLTPAVEHLEQYPVRPELWRRRGGLHAPVDAQPRDAVNGDAPARSAQEQRIHVADGRVLGRKEAVPPLLIAAIGHEPRAGRWLHVDEAQSGTLIVPLPLRS